MSIRLTFAFLFLFLLFSCQESSHAVNTPLLQLNEINLESGSGVFLVAGGKAKPEKNIKVYYHQPKNYSKDSRILMVLPGAGRNGDDYRDAWVAASEKHSVLILAPSYSKKDYLFEDYHLCGLIKDINLGEALSTMQGTHIERLDEQLFSFTLNPNSEEWLFADFDRIFRLIKEKTASSQTHYDLFGHSVGGQILHRFAIFQPTSKADQIIAANVGFYTLPDFETKLPFGVKGTPVSIDSLHQSFAKNLTILIGELDNERRLLSAESADRQGGNRLERGAYFYSYSKKVAAEMSANFNWAIDTIPRVGHSQQRMGEAAARILYE